MKILIVDDSAGNLRVLRAMLEAENYEVIEAGDGLEALAALEAETVDAIISDILMPNMDGYRLCKEVRNSGRWHGLPFIFYTATYVTPADEKLCFDMGGDRYLQKPATAKQLVAVLNETLNAPHRRCAGVLPGESEVMREYSERLVSKLEQKIEELEQARTDLMRANRELDHRVQERTAELKMANQELESFSYSVSHDLRSPLHHIRGYIDLVLRNSLGEFRGETLKHLQAVRGAAGRMEELIDALLDLAQVSRAEIQMQTVDLSSMAAGVFAELRQTDPQRAVTMEVTPGLIATGDPTLLHLVLVNLIGNAWKYTRKRADARISFGRFAGAEGEVYFVRDNGAGFDMAYVTKLFGAFQRLHGTYDFEGHGIGLATVRRIIQRHRGKIWGEGTVQQGATFYFTLGELPVEAASRDEVAAGQLALSF